MGRMPDTPDIERLARQVNEVIAAVDNIARPLREAHRIFLEPLEHGRQAIDGIQRLLNPIIAFAKAVEREERVGEAGWIPHPLLPLDQVTAELLANPDDLDAFLLDHLSKNWLLVAERLLDDEVFSILGNDHRETMHQALKAHHAGLYRCVPRTVFGEIEMAAHNKLGGQNLNRKISAQLRAVWDLVDELPLTALGFISTTGVAYTLVREKVYADTRTLGPDGRLPNRHDQIHGLSRRHASERDSANTLLLADIMFRLLAILAVEADEQERA